MRHTIPERSKVRVTMTDRRIDPTKAHTLQAPLSMRVGSKSRKPSGGGWTYVPDEMTT